MTKLINILQEYTVSEISNLVQNAIEDIFDNVRVRGEISGLKIASSGHAYFNIKDNNAVLACICWKATLLKIKNTPQEGAAVVVQGKLTTYHMQSKYQLTVQYIEPYGIGELLKLLAERKEKLAREGLFDEHRKLPIPYLPNIIGVVTSISGAVIRDIIHRVSSRFPTRIIIWPVTVQGETAAQEVSAALLGFNTIREKPDVIILARGGGSIEDLWAFNEEIVVRAIADSSIPIISAIGHETDWTLADFASSKRAPTPTAAAEFVTPVLLELSANIKFFGSALCKKLATYINHKEQIFQIYQSKILAYHRYYLKYSQVLDDISFRLVTTCQNFFNLQQMQVNLNITIPTKYIQIKNIALVNLTNQLITNFNKYYTLLLNKILIYGERLLRLDISKTLQLGFCTVRKQKNYISSIKDLTPLDYITVQLRDGELLTQVLEINTSQQNGIVTLTQERDDA